MFTLLCKFILKALFIACLSYEAEAQKQPTTAGFSSLKQWRGIYALPGVPAINCETWMIVDSTAMWLHPPTVYLDSALFTPSFGSPQNILWLNPANGLLLWSHIDSLSLPNTNPPGTILMYGAASAPANYLLCDGTAVSRTIYAALFAIIGTTYGVGDGSTTFNLPDMRQRFPLGKAVSGTGSTLGGTGGTIDHLHTVDPPNTTSGTPSATAQATALGPTVGSGTHTHDVNIAQFNSGTANPPFQTVNFIIKF